MTNTMLIHTRYDVVWVLMMFTGDDPVVFQNHTHTYFHIQFVYENKVLKRTSISMKRLERKPDTQLTLVRNTLCTAMDHYVAYPPPPSPSRV